MIPKSKEIYSHDMQGRRNKINLLQVPCVHQCSQGYVKINGDCEAVFDVKLYHAKYPSDDIPNLEDSLVDVESVLSLGPPLIKVL